MLKFNAMMTEGLRESGFINSQPSIEEFMTAIPHINETYHTSCTTSITNESGMESAHYCQQPSRDGTPPCPQFHQLQPPSVHRKNSITHHVKLPEYPWMREKKTPKKTNHQGKALVAVILSA